MKHNAKAKNKRIICLYARDLQSNINNGPEKPEYCSWCILNAVLANNNNNNKRCIAIY